MIRSLGVGVLCAFVFSSGVALGQDGTTAKAPPTAADSLPGEPSPLGLSLSPEAPKAPPAPGGRAPSFGAPTGKDDWSFRFGGSIAAWEAVGIGKSRSNATSGQHTIPLHVAPRVAGKAPVYTNTVGGFTMQYGNSIIVANLIMDMHVSGKEYEGYYNPTLGPAFSQAYLTVTPEPIGPLHVQMRLGAFSDAYGGPNQYGWGIYGPMLAIRGYGERITADYDQSANTRWSFGHGIVAVPGVPEDFVRGTYTGWTNVGMSTFVQHAHIGYSYQNKYQLRLHVADARGTDERTWVDNVGLTPFVPTPGAAQPAGTCAPTAGPAGGGTNVFRPACMPAHDGRMDVLLLEAHWWPDEYGQIGVTGGLWDFNHGFSVHDGIWWGVIYTKGGDDMTRTYLGPNGYTQRSDGTGRVAALSAEWDLSVARLLRAPASFDGNAPDLRVVLGGIFHKTLASHDPRMDGASGFMLGAELDYRMLPWFGVTLRSYAESRDAIATYTTATQANVTSYTAGGFGRYRVLSISPGLSFRTDWQSAERIELLYTHYFYNGFVDNNPGAPLDRDAITLGGALYFF